MSINTIQSIFKFLEKNNAWNREFQDAGYRLDLGYASCLPNAKAERLKTLLSKTLNTQSQPKMTSQAKFWQLMAQNQKCFSSIESFVSMLEIQAEINNESQRKHWRVNIANGIWERMFDALREQSAWGPKTAALFVKNVVNIHRRNQQLSFWDDAPVKFAKNDRIYLPVDKVIIAIFEALNLKRATFEGINNYLTSDCGFGPDEMIVWDDLWYWGFFTQKNSKKIDETTQANGGRSFEWNADKFWCQYSSPKDKVAEVEKLAEEFLSILGVAPARSLKQ